MKFSGCDPFKSSQSTIEISNQSKIWDLHNDAVLLDFSYSIKERELVLNWQYYFEDQRKLSSRIISLIFTGVSCLEVTKRDQAMPYSEDDCLSEMIYDASNNSFIVKLMGGQRIKVSSDELIFKI